MDMERDDRMFKVKQLQGATDYPRWRRNSKAYLSIKDTTLLGLREEPEGSTAAAMLNWRNASTLAKNSLILLLTDTVQIRCMAIIDNDESTAFQLWQHLESTYTASNEQAIQNIRVKLDSLVFAEGADWEEHINEFNNLIAQLAVQEVNIEDKVKKSMLIRSLPESLSVISTVASAQQEMPLENLDALVRAELDRKKNPHNFQGKAGKGSSIIPNADFVKRGRNGFRGPVRRANAAFKKRGNCHHCDKSGHYKRECRKWKKEQATKKKTPWSNNNNNAYRYPQQNQHQHAYQQEEINVQGLLASLQNIVNNGNNAPPPPPPPFGGFMAKLKFRANIAELSDEKTSDAYIDSGATHHFFHRREIFENYTRINDEPVKGASGISKIVGKGMVRLPINKSIFVEAYHALEFSSNILSSDSFQRTTISSFPKLKIANRLVSLWKRKPEEFSTHTH